MGESDGPDGSSRSGSACGPGLERIEGALRERPLALGRDADRRDAVLRRIGGGEDVGGGRAAHVVLGGLPAEQHDQVDPLRTRHRRFSSVATVPFGAVRIRASDVASATGGTLAGPDVDVDGASFDSRSLRPGQLFVPIVAERDGHDFIDSALAAGAGAYLTSRAPRRGDRDPGGRHGAGADGARRRGRATA